MKVLFNSFQLKGHVLEFHAQFHLVQHNKQYHMEALHRSFPLNVYRLGYLKQCQGFNYKLGCTRDNSL